MQDLKSENILPDNTFNSNLSDPKNIQATTNFDATLLNNAQLSNNFGDTLLTSADFMVANSADLKNLEDIIVEYSKNISNFASNIEINLDTSSILPEILSVKPNEEQV